MIKPVATLDDILHRPDWCAQLQKHGTKTSHSVKNGCAYQPIYRPAFCDHHAGVRQSKSASNAVCRQSVFTGNVNGLGLIWLLLRERHLGGTIILADAHIRYSAPITGRPRAVADLSSVSGDLDRLARGRKARVQLSVNLYGDEHPGAVFEGTYMVLPATEDDDEGSIQ